MELFRVAYAFPQERFEAAAVIYNQCFAEFLAVIVDLQEILGDVHDCDVVLEVLTGYAHRSGEEALVPGVATLIARARETRKADYETFLKKWEHLCATGFRQKLLSFLTSNQE